MSWRQVARDFAECGGCEDEGVQFFVVPEARKIKADGRGNRPFARVDLTDEPARTSVGGADLGRACEGFNGEGCFLDGRAPRGV